MPTEPSDTSATTDRTGVSQRTVLALRVLKLVLGIAVSALTLFRLVGVI